MEKRTQEMAEPAFDARRLILCEDIRMAKIMNVLAGNVMKR